MEDQQGAGESDAVVLRPPDLADVTDWHLFISHSSEDWELVEEVDKKFSDLKYRCQSYEKHFRGGVSTIINIISAVEKSCRVLLLLTPNFMRSKWAEMEVAMTLKKAERQNKSLLIGLVADMDMDDVPPYIRHTARCFHKSDSQWVKKIQRAIQDDVPVDLLPSGNVAHGLAWGYFYGYLNIILEGLPTRLSDSSNWVDLTKDKSLKKMIIPQDRVFKKFIIVIPASCICPSTFTEVDPNFEKVALVPFTGGAGRGIPSTLWKVTHPRTKEDYFFAGEFSTPLLSIYEMATSDLSIMSQEQMELQRMIYAAKVHEIVTHNTNAHCHDRTFITDFNDKDKEEKPLSEKIADSIKKQMERERVAASTVKIPKVEAFILHIGEDVETAEEIKKTLDAKGHKCSIYDEIRRGGGIFDDLYRGIRESKRVILVVSAAFLKSAKEEVWSYILLDEYAREKKCITIPVITDVTPDDVPGHIKDVATYLRMDDPLFEERLLDAIKLEIPTTSLIPAGNVATGFAWTYFFGYLNLIIPGFEERMKDREKWMPAEPGEESKEVLEKYKGDPDVSQKLLCNRLVLVVPQSCYSPSRMSDADPGFVAIAKMGVKKTRAGVAERPYDNVIWAVTDTAQNKTLYCACEYVSPISTMHKMTNVAGFGEKERTTQKEEFCNLLMEILEYPRNKQFHGKVVIVLYDDTDESRRPLSTVVYESVERQLNN